MTYFNIVKINKAFVKSLESDSYNQIFIQFVIGFAPHINIEVCLKALETIKN